MLSWLRQALIRDDGSSYELSVHSIDIAAGSSIVNLVELAKCLVSSWICSFLGGLGWLIDRRNDDISTFELSRRKKNLLWPQYLNFSFDLTFEFVFEYKLWPYFDHQSWACIKFLFLMSLHFLSYLKSNIWQNLI